MTQETAPQTEATTAVVPELLSPAKEKGDETYFALANFSLEIEYGAVKKTMTAAGGKSADLWKVPPDQLQLLPGFNMRLDPVAFRAHVDYLKGLIRRNGYLQDEPLVGCVLVEKESGVQKIFITEGAHRLTAVHEMIAAGELKLDALTVIPKTGKFTLADLLISSFLSNNGGKAYTTLETALNCLRLRRECNMEVFQIAERLGFTKSYVDTLMTLATAPKEIRDMVQSGQVSANIAIDVLRKKKDNVKEATTVLTKAVENAEKREAEAAKSKPAPKIAPEQQKKPEGTSVATANPETEKQPSATTVTKVVPAPAPAPAPKAPAKVRMSDVSPEDKLLKKQQELGPRLFAEVQRMEKAGLLKVEEKSELETLLFIIESINHVA